jgi:hypothetical protein
VGLIRITCKEASRLQSAAMDRPLTLAEQVSLRLHTAVCDACRTVHRQLAFLRRALRDYPGPESADHTGDQST